MFKWQRYAVGMAINHELTLTTVDRQKKLLDKAHCTLTTAMINQGELLELELLIKTLSPHCKGRSLALAIADDWIETHTFALNHAPKKAVDYLIKQKISPGNLYDYHCHHGQCTLWQLSKSRYQSYQLLAKKLGLTLKIIEPESYAKIRLFSQTALPQPYGIYYSPNLYIIQQGKIVFTHHVLNDAIQPAIELFEKLQPQKIYRLISKSACQTSAKLELMDLQEMYGVPSEFLSAYSAASRS